MQGERNLSEKQRYEQRKKMYEHRRRIQRARKIFFTGSFIVILILAGIITHFIETIFYGDDNRQNEANSTSNTTQSETDENLQGSTSANVENSQSLADSASTAVQSESTQQGTQDSTDTASALGGFGPQAGNETTYTLPNAEIMACAENGRVTADYFANVTFVGDSLLQNLKLNYSNTYAAHYLAYYDVEPADLLKGNVTTMGGPSVVAIDDIRANARKNMYIYLGSDALNSIEDEEFINDYDELLTYLKSELPADTVFYIQAISPVTEEKANQSESFSNERIKKLNDEIALLAYKHDINFLNTYTALAGENGNLRAEFASGSGGIQLNAAGAGAWIDYIITHTAYESSGPYEAGAPYIIS